MRTKQLSIYSSLAMLSPFLPLIPPYVRLLPLFFSFSTVSENSKQTLCSNFLRWKAVANIHHSTTPSPSMPSKGGSM